MIEIQNLYKYFDDFCALEDINITINDGECLVIEGESGSGKTTLLSIIGALMKPTSGKVTVDGQNIVSLPDFHISAYRNRVVGFVSQSFYLFENMSVEENISIPLTQSNISQKDSNNAVVKAMKDTNISHKAKTKVVKLSRGERQRVVMARALVNNAKIIICDEPTASLDKQNSLILIDLLIKLQKQNKTIIIATHDPLIFQSSLGLKRYKLC